MTKPVVFVGMPYYGSIEPEAYKAFLCNPSDDSIDTVCVDLSSSLLAHTFNLLWCIALNNRERKGLTHFAMLHSDIAPEPHWVNKLLDEMVATGADLVSAVVPIKSLDGVTSTAIDSPNPWEVERRLTMREIMQLPETFTAADCGYPGRTLCVNSGCWLADLSKLWTIDVRFQISNAIIRDESGAYCPKVFPEDWDFSRQVARRGGKIVATRKVKIAHYGRHGFDNESAWGRYDIDHMAKGQPLPALVR